jgi:hypothetical protein
MISGSGRSSARSGSKSGFGVGIRAPIDCRQRCNSPRSSLTKSGRFVARLSASPRSVARSYSSFVADELKRFIRYGPDGPDLTAELPAGGSNAAHFTSKVVDLLRRRGMIDADFFERLKTRVPGMLLKYKRGSAIVVRT